MSPSNSYFSLRTSAEKCERCRQFFLLAISPVVTQLIEDLTDAVDLIVSDIEMPGGDGMTLLCSVRESFPVIPIVLISAYSEPERQRYPSFSFEFIQKPFPPEILLTAIRKATKMMELRKRAINRSKGWPSES